MFEYNPTIKSECVVPARQQRYSMRSFVDATLDVIDTTVLANVLLDFYMGSQWPLVV